MTDPRGDDTWTRYKLRLKRRRLLWRSFRSRHRLTAVADRTAQIRPDTILVFSTVRNEAARLPFFLDHYRRLGAGHFLVVDNGSDDGTGELLAQQPDLSLWRTDASYRGARFGIDWIDWLLMHFGKGHWTLTVDADEILVYPDHDSRDLQALTSWLDATGRRAFGALMLDLYPDGALDAVPYRPGEDPFETLCWFDNGPWTVRRQAPVQNLWVQGGVRERAFFADTPRLGPTLNKLPLVKWHWRYAHVNSTHSLLPPGLNLAYDGPGGRGPSGVLLHSKFLDGVGDRARDEKHRGEHFSRPQDYDAYYDHLAARPCLKSDVSLRYEGWAQLERLGLMARGDWK